MNVKTEDSRSTSRAGALMPLQISTFGFRVETGTELPYYKRRQGAIEPDLLQELQKGSRTILANIVGDERP